VGCVLGSSLGNFNKPNALEFLRQTKNHLGDGRVLLLGVDMKKSKKILNIAYNDSEGITARLNLNILNHRIKLYAAKFDPSKFTHLAGYNEELGCVQMHLVSEVEQKIKISNRR